MQNIYHSVERETINASEWTRHGQIAKLVET